MKTLNFSTHSPRNIAVHVGVLLISFYIISLYFPLSLVQGEYLWTDLVQIILVITVFYVHSLIFLPILLKKKKIRKYIILTAIGFIVFWLIYLWLGALLSSTITRYMDGTQPEPWDLFMDPAKLRESLIFLLVAFIPASAVSLLYYISLIDHKEREKLLTSKYVEPYINLLLLIPIFVLFVFNTASTIETRIDLFYILVLFTIYFYLNACFFIKWLIEQKNTGRFIFLNLISLLLIIAGTSIIYSVDFLISNSYGNLLDLCIIFFVLFSFSVIYGYIRIKLRTSERIFGLKLGAKESELRLLKSQVNPHFLFNTLNTIYATALEENATRTAQSTAKVSNLIRYMQNDINKAFIPLENEIKYMEDFISIQKLRSGVPVEVKTNFQNIENKKISPGLLIPFVENAFKYGLNGPASLECSISVICEDNTILFECMNSYEENQKISGIGEGFGLGIKNVKKRLNLVYPGKHKLQINDFENVFKVNLQILTEK